MAATVSYGGVHLGITGSPSGLSGKFWRWAKRNLPSQVIRSEKAAQWVEHNISPQEVYEFASRSTWPGASLTGLTWLPYVPPRPIRVGSLWWPVGASRWAVSHWLATGEMVDTLLPLCYGNAAPWAPVVQNLVLDNDVAGEAWSVTVPMYLLPPRPLQRMGDYVAPPVNGVTQKNRLYLLTLVDARYYWWSQNTGEITITPGVTTWADLYAHLAVRAGLTGELDAVDPAYFLPHAYSALSQRYEPLPPILDAIALNCGQRIVRKFDGTVQAINLATSKTNRDASVAALTNARQAGDWFDFGRDLSAVLPKKVTCTFQRWVGGQPQAENFWTESVNLIDLADFASYTGHEAEKTFRCLAPANCQGPAEVPDNQNALLGIADKLARDFYGYQKESYFDRVYAGITPWTLEGLHDVEWTWRLDRCNTRIQRVPWNLDPERMLQSDGSELRTGDVVPVKVTSGTAEDGRYPAIINARDEVQPLGNRWKDVPSPEAVWAVGYNEEALDPNKRYKGLRVSINPADGVPVYAVQPVGGGGGGTRVVRCTMRGESPGQDVPLLTFHEMRLEPVSVDSDYFEVISSTRIRVRQSIFAWAVAHLWYNSVAFGGTGELAYTLALGSQGFRISPIKVPGELGVGASASCARLLVVNDEIYITAIQNTNRSSLFFADTGVNLTVWAMV